jgi:hypothetical protein
MLLYHGETLMLLDGHRTNSLRRGMARVRRKQEDEDWKARRSQQSAPVRRTP